MSHATVNSKVVTSLFDAVTHLPPADLESFSERFAEWRLQSHPQFKNKDRLNELTRRSEQATLTQTETEEYQSLATASQRDDYARLEALIELAESRGQSLDQAMADTDWRCGSDEA